MSKMDTEKRESGWFSKEIDKAIEEVSKWDPIDRSYVPEFPGSLDGDEQDVNAREAPVDKES